MWETGKKYKLKTECFDKVWWPKNSESVFGPACESSFTVKRIDSYGHAYITPSVYLNRNEYKYFERVTDDDSDVIKETLLQKIGRVLRFIFELILEFK